MFEKRWQLGHVEPAVLNESGQVHRRFITTDEPYRNSISHLPTGNPQRHSRVGFVSPLRSSRNLTTAVDYGYSVNSIFSSEYDEHRERTGNRSNATAQP